MGLSLNLTAEGSSPQGGLVYVSSMTIKMSFSEPYYVSQNIEKDSLSVVVHNKLIELDPLAEFSEDYVEGQDFKQKVVK